MARKETVSWDKLPMKERLNQANDAIKQHGIPDVWYWSYNPDKGRELVMYWLLNC